MLKFYLEGLHGMCVYVSIIGIYSLFLYVCIIGFCWGKHTSIFMPIIT